MEFWKKKPFILSPAARIFQAGGEGVANLKNRGMIGKTRASGGPEAYFPGKILQLEILKLLEINWNCQSYYHRVILYHFKSFTIPPGGPFWLPGGCVRSPNPPLSCLWAWPCTKTKITLLFQYWLDIFVIVLSSSFSSLRLALNFS